MAILAALRGVSKHYPIYDSAAGRLLGFLPGLVGISAFRPRRHVALQDIDLEIRRGETLCIVGENGSGKSTLLQILAGVMTPTSGTVDCRARVAALLELGAGFHPEFSGRDNVYLAAAIQGFSRAEIDRKFAEIEAFAEIGSFISQPVKTYSSGMLVRLAFAVAIHVDPEILIVDEALAVGDFAFRQRCLRKVQEMRARGVCIVLVSHALSDIKAIGDRVIWLDQGRIREQGPPDLVLSRYAKAMAEKDRRYQATHAGAASSHAIDLTLPNIDHRSGNGQAEITGIGIFDSTGDRLQWLNPNSQATVRIRFRANVRIAEPVCGFLMRNHLGVDFAGTDTAEEGLRLQPLESGQTQTISFHLALPALYPAHFSFSPFVREASGQTLDFIDNAVTLQMGPSDGVIYGYVHFPCRIEQNASLGGPRG